MGKKANPVLKDTGEIKKSLVPMIDKYLERVCGVPITHPLMVAFVTMMSERSSPMDQSITAHWITFAAGATVGAEMTVDNIFKHTEHEDNCDCGKCPPKGKQTPEPEAASGATSKERNRSTRGSKGKGGAR